jgi:hypothetical protein
VGTPYPCQVADSDPGFSGQERSNLSRLVDGDIVDLDLGQIVVGGVRNSVGASSSEVTIVVVSTGPITTECDVDDELEVTERGSDVARLV